MSLSLVFKKHRASADTVEVLRDGVRIHLLESPKQTLSLPLDLVHYVVEATLGIHGFFRRLAEGEPPVHARTPRTPEDFQLEALVETLQSDCWGTGTDDAQLYDLLLLDCHARAAPRPDFGPDELGSTRRALGELLDKWRLTPDGQVLKVHLAEEKDESAERRASP